VDVVSSICDRVDDEREISEELERIKYVVVQSER
jgi:hypothetical protein